MNAGVDRRVGIEIVDGQDQVVTGTTSSLIGSEDRVTFEDGTFYAKRLYLTAPRDGDYRFRAKIIASDDEVLKEEDYPFRVDTQAPSVGSISYNEGGYGMRRSGSVWKLGRGGSFDGGFVIDGIGDNSDIEKVEVKLYREDGSLHRRDEVAYDKQNGEATRRGDNGFFPTSNLDENFGVQFVATDVAGNSTASAIQTVRFDSEVGTPSEPYAVYDPSYSGSVIPGHRGYRAYTPGMDVKTNPVRLVWQVKKEHWHEYHEGGVTIVNTVGDEKIIHRDADHIYMMTTSPYGFSNNNSFRWSNFGQWAGVVFLMI